MAIRLVAGSFLFLTFPLLAQQDPDKPQVSPEQQARALTADKERLQREIHYAKERVGNSKSLLSEKLAGYKQTFRSIDAGTNAPPVPVAPPTPQLMPASIASQAQLGDFPNDTIALVNHRPVTQSALDRLTNFLRTSSGGATENQHAERAMYELIRIEAVNSTLEENGAAERAATAAASLHDGKPVADVIKEYGTCQGAAADGKVEIMRNSIFGPMVEMVAFNTKEGTHSMPFRTANGIMIVRAEKLEKGASPELDKVIGYAVQIPYSADEGAMQKAHMAINMGQVQIVVKDEKIMALLPPMFRPAAPQAADQRDEAPGDPMADPALVERALSEVSEALRKLGDSKEPGAAEQRASLQAQYGELKARLRAPKSAGAPAPVQAATPALDAKAIQAAMEEVQAAITKLGVPTDSAAKTQLEQLQQRYQSLKDALAGAAREPAPQLVPAPKK